MAKEKVQKAVEVATAEVEVVEATEEIKEDIATIDETANTDEDALSPWYYFFATGCGWCNKANPIVEGLIEDGHDVLMLDVAEPDNAQLRDELFAEYNTRCGTPWFVNADTGKSICGFREKDVLELWLKGEDIPEPPRPTGPPPKVPYQGSTDEENKTWSTSYTKWVTDNKHMPKDWQDRQRSATEILTAPRPKNDPPQVPNMQNTNDAEIDAWGVKLKVWQEENNHLPNMQDPGQIVQNMKNRLQQMQGQNPEAPKIVGDANTGPVAPQLNSLDAKVQALEVKIDKIMNHFGVK
jgi:thiol-disulfide isomerase/thioredoxin